MIKTYNEWLGDREDSENTSLVDEQSIMMVQRFAGLLHGLPDAQKSAIVERAICELRKIVE